MILLVFSKSLLTSYDSEVVVNQMRLGFLIVRNMKVSLRLKRDLQLYVSPHKLPFPKQLHLNAPMAS